MPFTRNAGNPTTMPTAAESMPAQASARGNGMPAFTMMAWVYAPTPRKAAWPSENKPVKPASSISPRPTTE